MVKRINVSMIEGLEALISTRMIEHSGIEVGDYIIYGLASKPKFLLCNGGAVSRVTYAALFEKIGVAFGSGDGSTTFNVPFAGGRHPLIAGQFSGGTNRVIGQSGGAETHKLTEAEMPIHNHGVGRNMSGAMQGSNEPIPVSTLNNLVNTTSKGGDQPHNNMPPFVVLGNLFIYAGV